MVVMRPGGRLSHPCSCSFEHRFAQVDERDIEIRNLFQQLERLERIHLRYGAIWVGSVT